MGKRMLIDAAHPEETRVVALSGNRLEEFDFESSTKKQVKGNIYLAKITRVEPSLQAAFVDYGGNRHGFLAFSEIHPDYYRIPVSDREAGEYDAPPVEPSVAMLESELARESSSESLEAEAPSESGLGLPTPFEQWPPAEAAAGETTVAETAMAETAETAETAVDAPVADEALNEIAAALPPAVAVAVDGDIENEVDNEPEPVPAAEAEEPSADLPSEVNDVAMAAPIEAVVSTEAFFESASPPPVEEVETLDDEEDAEEAGAERRRSHSLRHYKIQEVVKRRQIMLV
ncbi:MAG TPA: ribonuclease E/G, partial [Stellaceae bacterium]|nr:ribonuclease E/G [Stellaceae bacterium]